jgi:hypothetical protein
MNSNAVKILTEDIKRHLVEFLFDDMRQETENEAQNFVICSPKLDKS